MLYQCVDGYPNNQCQRLLEYFVRPNVTYTTVRMVDRVHGNTTSLGPRVALDGELVLGARGLEERLVRSSTTSDDANGGTAAARDRLLGAGRKADTGLVLVGRVTNHGSVVARCPGERATVTDLLLNIGDDGTFGALRYGENVADSENGLLAAVDEGTSVKALGGNEGLLAELVAVGVTENNTGERSTTEASLFRLRSILRESG